MCVGGRAKGGEGGSAAREGRVYTMEKRDGRRYKRKKEGRARLGGAGMGGAGGVLE